MILSPFPGQHFSVYNEKVWKARVWWGEPGSGQWPDPAPAPQQGLLSLGRSNGHLLKSSRGLGAVPGSSLGRAKDELAVPVRGGGLCSFVPAQNVAKWRLGGSLGFAGAGSPTRSNGQRILQLGQGVKQPWSCWAGEGQGLRTVTPRVLFIPVSGDNWLQPCNVGMQAEHPKTNPAPPGVPHLSPARAAHLPDWVSKGTAVSCHHLGPVARPRAGWGQPLSKSLS